MIDADIRKCGACRYYMHRTGRCGYKYNAPIMNSSAIGCYNFELDAEGRRAVRHTSTCRDRGEFSLKMTPQLKDILASAADQLQLSMTALVRHIFDKYDTGWLYDEEIVDKDLCKSGELSFNFHKVWNIPDLEAKEIRTMIATFCSSQYHIDQLKSHLKELE